MMKNSMLINSGPLNNFWVEVRETANYLCNQLPTKSKNYGEIILKEAWIKQQQNFQYIYIFGSLAFSNIPEEKRSKSNYKKVWKGILIGYSSDTTKHFRV